MKNLHVNRLARVLLAVLLTGSVTVAAGISDDPLLAKVMVNELEWRKRAGDGAVNWDADAWLGKDINKLWLKTEGVYAGGDTEDLEVQLLYSRAIASYWDLQLGWRGDPEPGPSRNWLAFGVRGLAPYFFDIDAAVFIGAGGRTAARLEVEYELLFTQRLILEPMLEVNLYGKADEASGIGSGLTGLELGLRLRYEIRREFAPYIGINWWNKFGDTRDLAKAAGEETDDLEFVAGVRFWF